MSCLPCYEATLQENPATIVLDAGLAPNTNYFWILQKDSASKFYQRQATTDANGKLNIDCSVLAKGLLNRSAGFFSLQIRDGANYLTKIGLTFSGTTYDCVSIKFVNADAQPANLYNVIK